jgi:hypothetical protein
MSLCLQTPGANSNPLGCNSVAPYSNLGLRGSRLRDTCRRVCQPSNCQNLNMSKFPGLPTAETRNDVEMLPHPPLACLIMFHDFGNLGTKNPLPLVFHECLKCRNPIGQPKVDFHTGHVTLSGFRTSRLHESKCKAPDSPTFKSPNSEMVPPMGSMAISLPSIQWLV